MSGIYIPGMGMPKSQENCKFFDYAPFRADYCVLFSTCKGIENCPLVAVPDHGRLIDADAMKESIICDDTDEHKILSTRKLHHELDKWIDERPTIIPADKDGAE